METVGAIVTGCILLAAALGIVIATLNYIIKGRGK